MYGSNITMTAERQLECNDTETEIWL